jgi:sigma-B regulation protein RsbU (phosphoserine phosphatase)
LLRGFALRDPDPSLIAETINRMLSDFSGSFDFVTCFYALFDPHSGLLTYVNCGHNPPIYVQNACQESSTSQALLRSGPALGMLPGIRYQASQLTLGSGDLLLMYTDGIVEARNAEGEFFDVQRLEVLLCQNAGLPANELIQSIIQSARQFSGYEVFADDTALVVLRRNPEV